MSGTRSLMDDLTTPRPAPTRPPPPSPNTPTTASKTAETLNPQASSLPNPPRSAHDIAASLITTSNKTKATTTANDLTARTSRADLERQSPRRWARGDLYAPHDLSSAEMAKHKKPRIKGRQNYDVIDQLGIDPRMHYKNFTMMGEYMSEMGRIRHSRETGLRPRNQRRMAKAIRRAIGVGLMPGTHRHPEILKRAEMMRRRDY